MSADDLKVKKASVLSILAVLGFVGALAISAVLLLTARAEHKDCERKGGVLLSSAWGGKCVKLEVL